MRTKGSSHGRIVQIIMRVYGEYIDGNASPKSIATNRHVLSIAAKTSGVEVSARACMHMDRIRVDSLASRSSAHMRSTS